MIERIELWKSETVKDTYFLCYKEASETEYEVPLVINSRVAIELLESLEKMFPK